MNDIEGFVLAGGANSRMGRRKASVVLGDKTLVERAWSNLSPVTNKVRVIGQCEAGSREENFEWIEDLAAETHSSMRGLTTALTYCESPWAMILACDLPFASAPLFRRIWSLHKDVFAAVVPVQPDGRIQPLCALYKRDQALQLATEMMAAGERSLRSVIRHLNSRRIEFNEIKDLENSDLFFLNVNAQEDLEQARGILASHESLSI